MRKEDLQRVRPGFDNPTLGSQAVFRLALQAMSMPGLEIELPPVAQLPGRGHGAAAMLLLALLDSDCTLWLSESLAGSETEAWLRFHTGCRCVPDPIGARFLWLAAGDDWPTLAEMEAGSDEYPDQSATCVMEVLNLDGTKGEHWALTGPGIPGERTLCAAGLPADFAEQWAANHTAFPRGVDVFLSAETRLVGLPRSTRLQTAVEA